MSYGALGMSGWAEKYVTNYAALCANFFGDGRFLGIESVRCLINSNPPPACLSLQRFLVSVDPGSRFTSGNVGKVTRFLATWQLAEMLPAGSAATHVTHTARPCWGLVGN